MKNNILIAFLFSTVLFSCQKKCDESECRGSSALFSFRLVDESFNDKVYGPFAEIDPDSVIVYGSNKGSISILLKELTVKNFDTIPVFQFNVDFIHSRYIIETRTADTTISDTIGTTYILENSDCCNIELLQYDAILNSQELCIDCKPINVHLLKR
jgi:hypothetical protein